MLLGDRSSYSYFPFNRRSENGAQVTSRASWGEPIVPIVFFQETTIHLIRYGGRQLINMEEGRLPSILISVEEVKN